MVFELSPLTSSCPLPFFLQPVSLLRLSISWPHRPWCPAWPTLLRLQPRKQVEMHNHLGPHRWSWEA